MNAHRSPSPALMFCLLVGLAACQMNKSNDAGIGSGDPSSRAAAAANESEYYEATHDGRIYVMGNKATYDAFQKNHHLPYTRTLIGEGPNGETVVIEVDKKDPELVDRLEASFKKRHSR